MKFKTALVLTAFLMSGFATAADPVTIDVSDVVAILGGTALAAVVAIGGAKLSLGGVAVAFKWVKGALFS